MQLNLKVQNKSIWMLIITACLVYCTVAIVNHYFFRTYALDLGLYTHALYEYSHGRMATTQLFLESNNLLLSDHFDLYLIFLSPLVYIFNDYTLLVVQIIALLFGAFGIYKLLDSSEDTKSYSWLGTFIFLFSFGVFGAVSFEYHSNVLSVCFIPWWLLAVHSRKTLLAFIWLIVLFIGKENFSFFIFFLCLALLWRNRSDKFLRKIFIVSAGISLIYFLTIIKWVMPSLAGGGEFVHFGKYPVLGGSMGDALTFMINYPIEFLKIFFINHLNGYPELNSEKLFFYIVLFFAGGWAMLLRPYYLIAIAPLLLQKMFTNQFTTWGTSYQYNIEFVPLLVLAVADGLKFLKLKFVWLIKWERAIVIKLILLTVSSS
ncbi:MAG: DUF2079 domain-containing protein, partial [Bacteroidota bacterium]